jgi:hypothetical protein
MLHCAEYNQSRLAILRLPSDHTDSVTLGIANNFLWAWLAMVACCRLMILAIHNPWLNACTDPFKYDWMLLMFLCRDTCIICGTV